MNSLVQTGTPPPNRYPLPVLNNSGLTIPGHAVMQVYGSSLVGTDTIYVVGIPTGASQAKYLINSPAAILPDEYGAATDSYPADVAILGNPALNQFVGPVGGGWAMSVNGSGYIFLGGLSGGFGRVAEKAGTTSGDDFPIVRIKNVSGMDKVDRSIYAFGTPLTPPPGAPRVPTFESAPPTASKPFVIGLQDIAFQDTGDAAPVGVVSVLIDYVDDTHRKADCITNDYAKLRSAHTGPATILWREFQGVSGGGTLGVQWAFVRLDAEFYRMVRGRAYQPVDSEMARFEIDHIVPLCGGLDPRQDPTDSTEKIWVANYPDGEWESGDDVYAVYLGPNTDPDAEWEALPKSESDDGASGLFVAVLTAAIPAGSTSQMGTIPATVYKILENGALESIGTRDVFNPFAYSLPATGIYPCSKTFRDLENDANDEFTITGADVLALLASLPGFGPQKSLASDGTSFLNIKWLGAPCATP